MQENIIPKAGEMIAMDRAIKHIIERFTAKKVLERDLVSFFTLKAVRMFTASFKEKREIEKIAQKVSAIRRHKKNIRAKNADKIASFLELGSWI